LICIHSVLYRPGVEDHEGKPIAFVVGMGLQVIEVMLENDK